MPLCVFLVFMLNIRNRSVPLLTYQGGARGGFIRETLFNPHFPKGEVNGYKHSADFLSLTSAISLVKMKQKATFY